MRSAHHIFLAALIAGHSRAEIEAAARALEIGDEIPNRKPIDREVSDSGVGRAKAETMPWFPTHATRCSGDRVCRPGEGNLPHVRETTPRGWRYKQWTQPYIHREAWVQSRSREMPTAPDSAAYAGLVAAAKNVQVRNLVVVTAGDFDYRDIVLNWVPPARVETRNLLGLGD